MATEFICSLRSAGGDYTTPQAWESAVQCNLTSAATVVLSHGGITGTIPDSSAVTGAVSGATGTAAHVTNNQILITGVAGGPFQNGEQIYRTAGVNYVVASSAPDSAIAVLECYNDWTSGLNAGVIISGWTTGASNGIIVRAASGQGGNGKYKIGSSYAGFALRHNGARIIELENNYIELRNLILDGINRTTECIYLDISAGAVTKHWILNCYCANGLAGVARALNRDSSYTYVINNVAYTCNTGFMLYAVGAAFNFGIIYNNTSVNCVQNGFRVGQVSSGHVTNGRIKNNLSSGAGTVDFNWGVFDSVVISNNASKDASATGGGGANNRVNQTFLFVDPGSMYYKLRGVDGGAKGYGVDLSADASYSFNTDIETSTRVAPWAIGAFKADASRPRARPIFCN